MIRLLVIVLLGMLVSCNKSHNDADTQTPSTIKLADIKQAAVLYTVTAPRSRSGGTDSNNDAGLYKIEFNGNTSIVRFTDEQDNLLDIVPDQVINLNDDLILLSFSDTQHIKLEYYYYIVRKSDGACFVILDVTAQELIYYREWHGRDYTKDQFGNVYYIRLPQNPDIGPNPILSLVKISTDNNGNITNQIISQNYPVLQDAAKPLFLLNSAGNILFDTSYNLMGLSQASGDFFIGNNITTTQNIFTINKDPEHAFYYIGCLSVADNSAVNLNKINFVSGKLEIESIKEIPELNSTPNWITSILTTSEHTVIIDRNQGLIVIKSLDNITVYPDAPTFDLDFKDQLTPHTDDYIILRDDDLNNGIIKKLNFNTGTVDELFNNPNYAIEHIAIDRDGTILNFSGYSKSDGERVVCEIRNGVFKELQKSQYTHEINTFVRIN